MSCCRPMDRTWTMEDNIKDRRPSKCEYGEEWNNSVGLNKSQIKKYSLLTMIGDERALIDTIRKNKGNG